MWSATRQPVRTAIGADADQVEGLPLPSLGRQMMLEQHERGGRNCGRTRLKSASRLGDHGQVATAAL